MRITSIVMTGLFVGAAGVIAGTLFAPNQGAKTRSRMARKGKLFRDYMIDNVYDFADSVTHPFENLEDQTRRLSKKANAKAKKIKAQAIQKLNS